MRGTASDVGGMVSATSKRNTVSESRIVTPGTQQIKLQGAVSLTIWGPNFPLSYFVTIFCGEV